jgi:hypothetical protein
VWRIHRRIGMSGGLFTEMLLREIDAEVTPELLDMLQSYHAEAFRRLIKWVRPLPGSKRLLAYLTDAGIPWAVATSGRMATAKGNLELLGIDPQQVVVITRDQVQRAKPDPDLFLAAAERLNTDIEAAVIVGDIGFFAILHTWGQNLMHHPYLHCVVPGGGLFADKQRWIACRRDFFLPVRVLSRFFCRRFLEMLEHAFNAGELHFFSALAQLQNRDAFQQCLIPVQKKEWVVCGIPGGNEGTARRLSLVRDGMDLTL